MVPFLEQVVREYFPGMSADLCFIFPNRRSMVFFRKYLADTVAVLGDSPLMAPEMFTVNDFFARIHGGRTADRVTLLLELYGCYRELNPRAETLDEFIFWGDIILGDFNDVDKYLADPSRLYANVADFRAMQDTFEYLTDTQRAAIEGFVSHFNDRSGRLTVDPGSANPNVKERFLQIWNILYPLYRRFGRVLESKGLSYEGMVYRGIAERLGSESVTDMLESAFHRRMKYVFVGLNALNECEKVLMRKMRDAGIAEFCWDYSGDIIRDSGNRSSFFMSGNVKEFPQKFNPDPDGVGVPCFNVISVPSSVGQVKQIPAILEKIAAEQAGGDMSRVGAIPDRKSGAPDAGCAVVLPDESLLTPLLNTVPPEIEAVNVTMGYPMTASSFYALMSEIAAMQLHLRRRADGWCFYYRQVWAMFSNSVFRKAMGEAGAAAAKSVKEGAKLYIPEQDLKCCPLFGTVFRPVVTDPRSAGKDSTDALAAYLTDVVSHIAPLLKDDPGLAVELEFAKEYFRNVNRLRSMGLGVLPVTFIRILEQLSAGVSVPFKGEPLKGLQIMGPLETRALDFRNIVLLSANEGIFPRRSVSSSFIPPELRKGFGLPTYEYQDAVWAYYFYRMVTRAENVWILYDSRTEGMKSGEESRYIKQLEYHFGLPLRRSAADARARTVEVEEEIPKTEDDVRTMKSVPLSASSIQSYIACPAKFYYSAVKGLAPEEEVSESMDAAMIGNVYHAVMQALYQGEDAMMSAPGQTGRATGPGLRSVDRAYIRDWTGRVPQIKAKVRSLMEEQLRDREITGRNLVIEDVIVRYVRKTLQRDLELMEKRGVESFRIEGLEMKLGAKVGDFRVKGFIDRLDSFVEGELRVVDYKTGKVLPEDLEITDENAADTVEAFFGDGPYAGKPKIAFQLFFYDMLLRKNGIDRGRQIFDSVYSTARLFSALPESVPMGESFYSLMEERLTGLLGELCDLSVPFRRTEDREVCTYCDFRIICGR